MQQQQQITDFVSRYQQNFPLQCLALLLSWLMLLILPDVVVVASGLNLLTHQY